MKKKFKHLLKMNMANLISDIGMLWFNICFQWAKIKAGGDASKIPPATIGKLIGKPTVDQEVYMKAISHFMEICEKLSIDFEMLKFRSILVHYGQSDLGEEAHRCIKKVLERPRPRRAIYDYMHQIGDIPEKIHSEMMWSGPFHGWLDEVL